MPAPDYTPGPADFVIGCDPGQRSIFSFAIPKSKATSAKLNGQFEHATMSRQRYYNESGASLAMWKSSRWNRSVKTEIDAIRSYKTASLDAFRLAVIANREVDDALWNHLTHPRMANQRFRLHGGKQRSFSRVLEPLRRHSAKGKRVVIAFGSAKFAPGGSGRMAVPTTRAFNEVARRFPTFLVDEFRTSKICAADDSELCSVQNSSGTPIHALMWCRPTINNKSGFLVDRDFNAAVNMRRCLLDRPASMTRSGQPSLETEVGHTIRANPPKATRRGFVHTRRESRRALEARRAIKTIAGSPH